MADIVPYTFTTDVVPLQEAQEQLAPGLYQCIHFTVTDADALVMLLGKIRAWFVGRDEVTLLYHGPTATGLGFVVMEWDGYAVDKLFIAFLEHDDLVDDYSIYYRERED